MNVEVHASVDSLFIIRHTWKEKTGVFFVLSTFCTGDDLQSVIDYSRNNFTSFPLKLKRKYGVSVEKHYFYKYYKYDALEETILQKRELFVKRIVLSTSRSVDVFSQMCLLNQNSITT